MKTFKHISFKNLVLLALTTTFFALPAKAQMTDNGYANVDWQYNFPLGNAFTDRSSGWGMNFDGGYFLTENWAIGAFLSYHTNHEYVPRRTITAGSASLTTDQQHSTFQLPFGLETRYAWNRGRAFQPYAGLRAGAQYARLSSEFNIFENEDNTWGFYVSPEVGINIFPWAYGPGLHIAAYYSYATNQGGVMQCGVDGLNNVGVRIGISF